jgi:2-polyprenyl-3-methyl-5-hydroxy-6-metoxy-1,4-benzoquinol methylase
MDCCRAQALDTEFSERIAAMNLRHYRRRGPSKTTRILVEALRAEGVAGRTLLDIGGGVGAISHELLRSNLSHATSVDAAGAYVDASRKEAERQGHSGRLSLRHGDFVMLADDIKPADIVTLDRVICCYPDMPALVDSSVAHARQAYGLVYPRDVWWTRQGARMLNAYFRLRRHSFRTFIHSAESVHARVVAQGFQLQFRQLTAVWQVQVYTRA